MGFESFRVELIGEVPATDVRAAVLSLPGVAPDPDGGVMAGEYFRLSDGRHVLELHLSVSPVSLSVRFQLAHPPTVDAEFLEVVRHLMTHTAMRVRVLADVPVEFTLADYDRFAAVVLESIAHERRGWVATFGPQTLAGSTAEVYRRIIFPQCAPAVGRQP